MKNYKEVSIIKTDRKKFILLISALFSVFLGFSLLAFLIAPALKITQIANSKVFDVSKNYYVVCVDTKLTSQKDALNEAQSFKAKGGAGVLFFDSTYFITISSYFKKSDAQKVAENLTTEELPFCVLDFNIQLNLKDFEKDEKQEFLTYFNFCLNLIDEQKALAEDLDTNSISKINANLKVKNMLLKAQNYSHNLLNSNNKNLQKLSSTMITFSSILDYASDEDLLDLAVLPYSSSIRQAEMQCLLTLKNFKL
ncbi:MAG: hypothetical protein IJ837_02480 [Clostridia bacterium]|nr:hypothetical protein [Clostridia bacterium]